MNRPSRGYQTAVYPQPLQASYFYRPAFLTWALEGASNGSVSPLSLNRVNAR